MNPIKTEIGYCTTERIYVRGHDLANDLIGKVDFIDMMMLVVLGRKCEGNERDMINAIMVTVMDHGLTPSALAARLTYLGAPEAMQAAVAAGLLGAGSVFLGAMENATLMLRDLVKSLPENAGDEQFLDIATAFYKDRRVARQTIYGLGHNIHVNGDPRIPALREVSQRNGYYGVHWRAMEQLEAVSGILGKRRLPINAAGAVGAMVADMQLPPTLARGLTLISRCAGLIGHVLEEQSSPTGQALWDLVLRQDPRNAVHS
ncbi:citryl-CoA lyase [Noviherbaspirillum sedimenti]|uniref:citrate synthase (unknown stereospecificity) n=1 Tax=Noviherbaspirillum sedimenti TaxID=2320865 RepID=A0A3A3G8N8_9BURK|nr:citryl-CoA lyase [Noviherbaspirillum sedimenti]RJG03119.1 citryl-CoA lyase [Noviherbaspirillum sedimenti]